MFIVSVEKTECCNMHTKEKEKSGTCCQEGKKERAEQATYEHSVFKSEEQNE